MNNKSNKKSNTEQQKKEKITNTAQKKKFYIKDFFSKCGQL